MVASAKARGLEVGRYTVDAEISLSRTSDFFCASASSVFLIASSPFMRFTSSFASKSFERPLLIFSASSFTSPTLTLYSDLYPARNDRYDLGVT